MDDIEQEIINNLILEGALQPAGIDSETGEILYTFSDKIKTLMPDLYKEHVTSINKEIMYFWENGYLDIDLLSDNPNITLTDKAINSKDFLKLDREKQRSLQEIKRILLG
jgi:hypothetical protein